jgi:NodT family efflux transporter outer membrane factor (OMF) lipoprotein
MQRYWLLLALVAAGCTVGPDYQPPTPSAPPSWSEASGPVDNGPDSAERLARWWQEFHDPVLTDLIERAAADNYDVRIAAERIVEARAERSTVSAAEDPTLNAGGHAARARSSTNASYPPGIGSYNDFLLGFDASWEIDLFGGTRRAVEAQDALVQSVEEGRHAALLMVLSEVAADYATLRATQQRMQIADANIKAALEGQSLAQDRLKRGLATPLEVAEADGQLDLERASVPDLKALVAHEIHALSILIGKKPTALQALLAQPSPPLPLPPSLPLELPSEMVRNRPDIRIAERRLAAANAGIGVVTAAFFPRFQIPLALPIDSGHLSNLFDVGSLGWSVALEATQPILDGGRRDANLARAQSIAEQSRLAYEKTVLQAFGDVEDALVDYSAEAERHTALVASLEADRVALDHSTRLFRNGLGDFLRVLDAERSIFAAEDAIARSELAQIQHSIALFKALGAGW